MSTLDLFYITVAIGNVAVPVLMILKNKKFNNKEKVKKILKTVMIMGGLALIVIAWIFWKNGRSN